jgi:hypothetical protein
MVTGILNYFSLGLFDLMLLAIGVCVVLVAFVYLAVEDHIMWRRWKKERQSRGEFLQ